MALLWFGGFEGLDYGDYLNVGDHEFGGYGIEMVAGSTYGGGIGTTVGAATGIKCMNITNGAARYAEFAISGEPATFITGHARCWSVNPTLTAGYPAYWFKNAAGDSHCKIHVSLDGNGDTIFTLTNSADSTLATSSPIPLSHSSSDIHYIEIKITIHASAGTCKININNTTVMDETSLDTYNTGNAGVGLLRMYSGTTGSTYIDDWYICDSTGAAPHNDMLGPCKVEEILPSADGTHTDWTALAGNRYAAIDDSTAHGHDSDATYVYSATATDQITTAFADVSITDTIFAISHMWHMRYEGYTTAEVTQQFRIGGADYDGDDYTVYSTYHCHREIFTVNPADSGAWEDADIDGLEAGLALKSITA